MRLSFSYTTELQIRRCGMTYGQLSTSDSMPSAMTAEDMGALQQQTLLHKDAVAGS